MRTSNAIGLEAAKLQRYRVLKVDRLLCASRPLKWYLDRIDKSMRRRLDLHLIVEVHLRFFAACCIVYFLSKRVLKTRKARGKS